MRAVEILEDFTGYPNGKETVFRADPEPVEVANDFADLIIGKGHAKAATKKPLVANEKETDA